MPSKIHNFVSTLIRADFACHAKALEEKKEDMSIRIDGSQVKYEMFFIAILIQLCSHHLPSGGQDAIPYSWI